MNFRELYDNNCKAIETMLSVVWCGESRDEQQKKYAAEMKASLREMFAPSEAMPVVQCMNLYKPVHSVSDTVAKDLVGGLWKFPYAPYEHQYRCWNTLLNGKTEEGKPMSIVVTTGTGSGKTECFMMPLVKDLIKEGKKGQIQALFLYPLNALMEDQKERLEKMLEGSDLTYAVYNGDLPEKEPAATDTTDHAEDVRRTIAHLRGEYKDAEGNVKYRFGKLLYTREQVRTTPPNILLTNPTMLEYILLRQADSTLIDPALKSLRWVAIDETHSYTGAGAAELAMLLRRVLLAFDVKAEDVRFATSSATFGNAATPEEAEIEKDKLRKFIGGITGLVPAQVEVVDGVRIGEDAVTENEDKESWKKICKNDYMSLSDLFPDGSISEKLGKLEEMCKREDALEKPAALKMKVKVHFFYRVPNNGLYVKLTEHEDGCLKIYPKSSLMAEENDPPMLELTRCRQCGGYVVVAMRDAESGAYEPLMSDDSDMFDIEEDSDLGGGVKKPVMLGMKNESVEMGDGNVMLKAEGGLLKPVVDGSMSAGGWHIVGNVNYRCPYCNAKVSKKKRDDSDEADDYGGERYAKLSRFRLSAEVVSRNLAPSILDQLEKDGNPEGKLMLHDGQQYISFVDSRQAAAISTLRQNVEQEKAWVYSTVFHELCRRKAEESEVKKKISELKAKYLESEDEDTFNEIAALKKKISGCISWKEIFETLKENKYCDVFCKLFVKRSGSSDEIGPDGKVSESAKIKYVYSVMASYLSKQPKASPSPETLGLFHATYPQLNKVKLPGSVTAFNGLLGEDAKITDQDWRDLLQIFLDYTVRSNQSVFFKMDGLKIDIFDLTRFATEKPRRRPVKRPHVEPGKLGIMSRVVTYLGALLSASEDMVQIRKTVIDNIDAVNAVLDDLWKTLTVDTGLIKWGEVLKGEVPTFEKESFNGDGEEPYRLNLCDISFKLYEKVRLCDVHGGEKFKCMRPVGTVFKGLSIYPTRTKVGRIGDECEEWGVYPYYDGSAEKADPDKLKAWAAENRKLLWECGLWGEDGTCKNILDDIHLMPNLFMQAEHTAQVDKEVSRTLQGEFKRHGINILACSTTMEMGVDLGDLELVMLSSVPPMPANYKQRAGRSGRNNKVRSVCLTLCGSDAVGLRTLYNPIERIISRPVAVPKVDLMSEQVVKRHVNSYLVREFGVFGSSGGGGTLTQKVVDFFTPYRIEKESGNKGRLIVTDPGTGHPVHPDSGMGDETHTRYKEFIDKCSDVASIAKVKDGLVSLLRDTCYSGEENVDKVVKMSKETIERCYAEICSKVEDIKWAYDHDAKDKPKFRNKLEIQYIEVLAERLINYWATHRFTPNANMPVNVLSLNLNASHGLFPVRYSSNPSYSLREAIAQYVPGNCVVVDGVVYKVRGIEFRNMYNPVNTFKKISRNTECVKIDELAASAIPWPINDKTELTLVSPTGFLPDLSEETTRIIEDNVYTHVSAQLIGATKWVGDEPDKMISVRTNKDDSGDAKILYYNEGVGHGFCFCKKCGRMVLEYEAADEETGLPSEMNSVRSKKDPDSRYHRAISGKNVGKKCVGSNPAEGILRNVIIGDLIQTDYCELRIREVSGGKWIGIRKGYEKLLYTLSIAFSQSLVEVLGKERGAVDFAITPTGRICIFDTNPGGAGYSNQMKDAAILKSVMMSSKKILEEAKGKNASDILLDKFTVRHLKNIDVDVAITWLVDAVKSFEA